MTGFDLAARTLSLDYLAERRARCDARLRPSRRRRRRRAYSYFGHDDWAEYAPELKSLTGALDLALADPLGLRGRRGRGRRGRARDAWLTFVVVGGGPDRRRDGRADRGARTRHAAPRLPRRSTRARARVLLIEATDRLLGTFPESLAHRAEKSARLPRRDDAAQHDRRRRRRRVGRGRSRRRPDARASLRAAPSGRPASPPPHSPRLLAAAVGRRDRPRRPPRSSSPT